MKRLSVIIPMYKVEPFVERCLRSLEDQDIPKDEFEIICINDGSPDNSPGIVAKLQNEYDNIILINQENQGVSCARNKGIDKATGKYVMFIDPDDFVEPSCFRGILRTIERYQGQVSFLGFTFLNEKGEILKRVLKDELQHKVYSGIEAYFLGRKDGSTDPDRMWAVLFDAHFLNRNSLHYLPDVPYLEDGEFIARILCLAERCIFDAHSFYQRTTRPGSATNSELLFSSKAIKGFLLAANNLKSFQQNRNLSKEQRNFLNQPICKFVILALMSSLQKPYYYNFITIRKELLKNGFERLDQIGVVKPYIYYTYIYNSMKWAFLFHALKKEFKVLIKNILRKTKKFKSSPSAA
jgi:glycosyltransferase involved in cell wall biosynthesis